MRILYVITSTTIGGAEKTLFSLSTRLDPKKFDVAGVVSLKPKGHYAQKISHAGIRIESVNMGFFPTPGDIIRLARLIEDAKPDIVHAFLYKTIQICRIIKILYGGSFRLVSSPRVTYRTRALPLLWVDRVLKGADDVLICESEINKRLFTADLGYPERKTRLIYNGLEARLFAPDKPAREKKRAEIGVGPEEILVGTVGRLDPQKGQGPFLRALSRLPGNAGVKAVVIGDGPDRRMLETLLSTLGIKKWCFLAGEQEEIAPWLWAMDIFALPSLWEGVPNAALEAMAAGLPVVASSVDGVREIIEEGKTGLLVQPGNPLQMSKAILTLANNRQLRTALGKAASRHVSENFTLDMMVKKYEEAYASA